MTIPFFIPQDIQCLLSTSPSEEDSAFISSMLDRIKSGSGCTLKKKRFGNKVVYTLNANTNGRAHRLIFERVSLEEGGSGFVLRSIAWNHDYAKALTWSSIKYLDKSIYSSARLEVAEEESRRLVCHHSRWYELSLSQTDVFEGLQFPALIVGPPGSGKTLMALAYLQEQALAHQQKRDAGILKMLYITGNKKLSNELKSSWSAWEKTALSLKPPVIMSFLTVGELSSYAHEGKISLSSEEVIKLLNRIGGGRGSESYYDEFLLNAHLLNQDMGKTYEESLYQHTGSSKSFLSEPESKKKAYTLYQRLQTELEKSNAYIAGMSPIPEGDGSDSYDCIVVDEIQNETTCDLLNSLSFSRRDQSNNPQVIFLGDSLQKAAKRISSVSLLEPSLHAHSLTLHTSHLSHSHRLPAFVNDCAEKLVLLFHMLHGGKLDKTAYSSMSQHRPVSSDSEQHSVQFIDESRRQELQRLGSNAKSVVLVFREEDRKAAEKLVPDGLILTVEEAQGLERSEVCVYLPKETRSLFSSIDAIMKQQGISNDTPLKVLNNLSPKKGVHGDLEYLSKLYIALTRTYGTVWLYTDIKNEELRGYTFLSWMHAQFRPGNTKNIEETRSTVQEWLQSIDDLKNKGLLEQASRMLRQHLELSTAEAAAYLRQTISAEEAQFHEWLRSYRATKVIPPLASVPAPPSAGLSSDSQVAERCSSATLPQKTAVGSKGNRTVEQTRVKNSSSKGEASALPPPPKSIPVVVQVLTQILAQEPYSEQQLIKLLQIPLGSRIWEREQEEVLLEILTNDLYRNAIIGALLNNRSILDNIPSLDGLLLRHTGQSSKRWYQDVKQLNKLRHLSSSKKFPKLHTLPLLIAALNNREDMAYCCRLADLNKALNNGATPALIAAQEGKTESLEALINAKKEDGSWGADLNIATDEGATPAYMAAEMGQTVALSLLMKAKNPDGSWRVDLNQAANDGATPVFIAAQEEQIGAFLLLMKATNADGSWRVDLNKAMDNGATFAYVAAQRGQETILKELISAKNADGSWRVDLNKAKSGGITPAYIAAKMGQTAALSLLMEAKNPDGSWRVDLNQATKDGATPAFLAAEMGQTESLSLLMDAKNPDGSWRVDLNRAMNNGATPAFVAVQEGNEAALSLLMDAKNPDGSWRIDLNRAMDSGATPAFIAAQEGEEAILEALISAKNSDGSWRVDLNKGLSDGTTPLFIAALNGRNQIVSRLLRRGAEINACARYSYSALTNHVARLNYEIRERMHHFLKDKSEGDIISISPLELARILGHNDIVTQLLKAQQESLMAQAGRERYGLYSNIEKTLSSSFASDASQSPLLRA